MSQVLINQYLGELDRLKKIGGTHCESVVREAFKDLPDRLPAEAVTLAAYHLARHVRSIERERAAAQGVG